MISCKVILRYLKPNVYPKREQSCVVQSDMPLEVIPTVGSILSVDTDDFGSIRGRVVSVEHFTERRKGNFERYAWQHLCEIILQEESE